MGRMPCGRNPQNRIADNMLGRKLATLQLKIIITSIVWHFELMPTPPSLSSFAEHDVLTGEPEQCYVSLERVER